MEPRRNAQTDSLAAALADGATIDWRAVDTTADGASNADLVRQLRVIAAMRGRQVTTLAISRPWLGRVATAVYAFGVAIAAVKVLLALAGVPGALARSSPSSLIGPFTFNLAIFGVGGLLMVFGGGRDRRLQLLGGLYLTIASAFVEPFLSHATGPASVLLDVLALANPEAFMALGVWLFAWAFPQEPVTPRGRQVAGAGRRDLRLRLRAAARQRGALRERVRRRVAGELGREDPPLGSGRESARCTHPCRQLPRRC